MQRKRRLRLREPGKRFASFDTKAMVVVLFSFCRKKVGRMYLLRKHWQGSWTGNARRSRLWSKDLTRLFFLKKEILESVKES